MRLSIRIAGQIRRSLFHEGWHGPAIFEVLRDVDAEQAATVTPAAKHSIWALVRHMRAWQEIALGALDGKALPSTSDSELVGWEPIPEATEGAWRRELSKFGKAASA